MGYVGNVPQSDTVLRLEQRKSFALGLWIRDASGRLLDITGSEFRIVMRKKIPNADPGDGTNLIVNYFATMVDPTGGYCSFYLQAVDLDHPAGEYLYAIVMINEGYSSVVVTGVIDLQPNTEFSSVNETYIGNNVPMSLTIDMQGPNVLNVFTGPTLAPGTTSFTNEDKAKLDGIDAGAQVNVHADWAAPDESPAAIHNKPALGTAAFEDVQDIAVPRDGQPKDVLMKNGPGPTDYGWAVPPVGPGPGNLTAVGIAAGRVPTANGADSWGWLPIPAPPVSSVNDKTGVVILTADDIAATAARLWLTPAERTKIAAVKTNPDWTDRTN